MRPEGPHSEKYGEVLAAVRDGVCPHCGAELDQSLGAHLARQCDDKRDAEQRALDDDHGVGR